LSDEFGHADAKSSVQNEHLAAGDEPPVEEDVDGLIDERFERHDGAGRELFGLVAWKSRAAELDYQPDGIGGSAGRSIDHEWTSVAARDCAKRRGGT
jgi:hypothetical protein